MPTASAPRKDPMKASRLDTRTLGPELWERGDDLERRCYSGENETAATP
jgi:hypothetical protein